MNIFPKCSMSQNKDKHAKLTEHFFNPYVLVASNFGLGLSLWMPGTVGTLMGIPAYYYLSQYPANIYWLVVVLLSVVGTVICHQASQILQTHDHSGIVIDELCGYLVTVGFVLHFSWWVAGVGFVLFRIFDILKPWPIGKIDEKVNGGLGIMADDLMAGLYAGLSLSFWYGWVDLSF